MILNTFYITYTNSRERECQQDRVHEVNEVNMEGGNDEAFHWPSHSGNNDHPKWFLYQYIPLKTGFVRHILAPYSSYSAFVWQACTWGTTSSHKSNIWRVKNISTWVMLIETSMNQTSKATMTEINFINFFWKFVWQLELHKWVQNLAQLKWCNVLFLANTRAIKNPAYSFKL